MRVILSSLALRCPGWHGPPGWPRQGMILYTPLNPRSQRGLPLSALWCHHGCHSQPLNCQSKTLIEVSTRAPSFLAARACPREIKGGQNTARSRERALPAYSYTCQLVLCHSNVGHIRDHGARKLPSVEQQHQPGVEGQRLTHGKHIAPGWSNAAALVW